MNPTCVKKAVVRVIGLIGFLFALTPIYISDQRPLESLRASSLADFSE
ncbi:MAG: hypothetical protein HPY59_00640 [Anaerolineae bacterium]|nr:hypothetical protein [Anaerolineae bacterium]